MFWSIRFVAQEGHQIDIQMERSADG